MIFTLDDVAYSSENPIQISNAKLLLYKTYKVINPKLSRAYNYAILLKWSVFKRDKTLELTWRKGPFN